MKKTIGIFAHVDAGKTTLSERLLYETETIRRPGRVDDRNTILDYGETERRRGITIFSDVAKFSFNDNEYYLVDTPGHMDFSPQAERALSVIDYGILVVSATDGVQAHTKTLWNMLSSAGKPVVIFINKSDMANANKDAVLKSLNDTFNDCIDYMVDSSEELALCSDKLLEKYTETGEDIRFSQEVITLVQNRMIFPCFFGSALTGEGISYFLSSLDALTKTNYDVLADFSANVFKILNTQDGNRVTFLKIISGTLSVKDKIFIAEETEKVNEIRMYMGGKYTSAQTASAGDICGVCGLGSVRAGETLGACAEPVAFTFTPSVMYGIHYEENQLQALLSALRILEDEEPTLSVSWNNELRDLRVGIMGTIQLEILEEELQRRFNLKVTFCDCKVMYRETITDSVFGCGHFEPLKHYAEVHFQLKPLPRGSGIRFSSVLSTDVLSSNYQNLIRSHVFEKQHLGPLTGSPVTDIEFVLTNGRAHEKHTSGGDFRESVYRAIRQGLFSAKTVLLEPIYDFETLVAPENAGRIMADIQKMHGKTNPPVQLSEGILLTGTVPVATALTYPTELAIQTGGEVQLSFKPAGYALCHNQAEVIESMGYDRERDIENSPNSVFVSHGTVFSIPWQEAETHMHLAYTIS